MIYSNLKFRISTCLFVTILILSCNHVKYPFGERLYNTHCADCHMDDGSGLSSLYPSMTNESIVDNYTSIPCVIRHGINDSSSIIQMLPLKKISAVEIANITNFILQDLNGSDKMVLLDEVNSILSECLESQ